MHAGFSLLLALSLSSLVAPADDPWQLAETNSEQSRRAIAFCSRYAAGWLAHADPATGLLPRTLTGDMLWNSRDCAADNYPFIVVTAWATDSYHLKKACLAILEQERKLTPRLDSLPDDFVFATQAFRPGPPKLDDLIFGAAEYAKDGLIPITELTGPGPWLARMEELIRDIWKHAAIDSGAGRIPTENVEVTGDLLQGMSRLYWLTGNEDYRQWTFRLADHWLLDRDLLAEESLRLRDHGSEIIGGLSEAYLIASKTDAPRRQRYRPRLHAILDRVLEAGRNEHGLLWNAINPKTGQVARRGLSDGWGYVYNAFLTTAAVDDEPRYRDAVRHVLENIHNYRGYDWEPGRPGGSADGYADSIEGALNLLNRLPVRSAFEWVDSEIQFIFNKQRPDGILEAWYGDGNSARTMMMYAMWKTQGITASPWTEDLKLGATRSPDGKLCVSVAGDFAWNGHLRFDRPRHRDYFHMPMDYPRINQFPEWFTVELDRHYTVELDGGPSQPVTGKELLGLPLQLKPGQRVRLTVAENDTPAASAPSATRLMRYTPGSKEEALAWQKDVRTKLARLLKIDDLNGKRIDPEPRAAGSKPHGVYTLRDLAISSTPDRRIRVLVGVPKGTGPFPAVVCIHGHGGDRRIVYDASSVYKGFAGALASKGFLTIACDVGQHEVREKGRTLMGERLWDLMRCVDYLQTLPEVDKKRIGCAGLSLGGEMAMWLSAMDERIAATVSSGFLTVMDQMEKNHCMCWKFDGLRELVDYADIYALIAPRPLQCQNGEKEPPNMFTPALARRALDEIKTIYADLGRPQNVELDIHAGAHEIDLPALLRFLETHLAAK